MNSFDLEILSNIFQKNRKIYFGLLIATFITSIVITLFLKNEYSSEASLISSRSSLSNSNISSSSASSSVARFLPFSSGGHDDPNIEYAINRSFSYDFLSKFIVKHDLLPTLLAFKKFNKKTNEIQYHASANNLKISNLFPKGEIDYEIIHIQDAVKILRKKFRLYSDIETSIITAKFSYYSPQLSKNILVDLIEDLNADIAINDAAGAQRNIDYIATVIAKYPQPKISSTLAQLLESNLAKLVVANAQVEYSLSIVDSPILPIKKSWPSRTFIVLSSILSMILVCIVSLMVEYQLSANNSKKISTDN